MENEKTTVNPLYFQNFLEMNVMEIAGAITYGLSPEESMKRITERFNKLCNSMSQYIKWDELTEKDCDNMHFGTWTTEEDLYDFDIPALDEKFKLGSITEEEYNERKDCLFRSAKVRLIPIYFASIIPDGLDIVTIDGKLEKFEKGKTDLDTRFGMLAFGIIPKEPEHEEPVVES